MERYRNKYDIVIFQETHSTESTAQVWANEWGGEVIFSHGETNARGIAMFIRKNPKFIVEDIERDKAGRYIIFNIEENREKVSCVAIYAPNQDRPEFFKDIAKRLQNRREKKLIVGDFNVVLDVEKDRLNTYYNNQKAKEEILNLMDEYMLTEIWRDRNPESKMFSWTNKRSIDDPRVRASRIDYALISYGLDQNVEHCTYVSSTHTDHRAYLIVVDLNPIERGTGFWKFNSSLLRDKDFLHQMGRKLEEIVVECESMDPKETWERIKTKVKVESQKYSRNKSQDDQLIIAQLSEVINEMEDRMPLPKEENGILEQSRIDLEEKLEERIKGIMFRSKTKWFEEGEKTTKYFLSLEKARYNAKTCTCIYDTEGKLTQDTKKILEVQTQFYQELYSEDDFVHFSLQNSSGIKVPKDLKNKQEQEITYCELEEAIKHMNNGKTPGEDGIPVEFYKIFWRHLRSPFMAMVENVYLTKELHPTASVGILNLIPKANKDTRYIKNLRPITLLNVDYKIIEKTIANRMIPALETIIHSDQRGFMKNRRIAVNIRKLLDIINFAKEEDLEALVLSLDFVKCFDKCSFQILHGSLDFFGFGENIKEWTRIFYKNFKVKIQNNGFFSPLIDIKKGVHQGGCCSSIYFLVIAEILAMALRGNEKIEGINIYQIRNLLNQFADDTDVCSLNSCSSLKSIFEELERFRLQSGIHYEL